MTGALELLGIVAGLGVHTARAVRPTVRMQILRYGATPRALRAEVFDWELDAPEVGESSEPDARIYRFPDHDPIGA